ncbi:hypothetical protein QN277_005184 [Acacia crassicarpa]|uniref:Thioredoxin domain-containing protein n=1 Tax=Acacia crassicarpa TaxID=499986 RepID=A0AAE1MB82_9FABA|nr:hypothetical protein QN277_005184 [Acacia crassicarpa]
MASTTPYFTTSDPSVILFPRRLKPILSFFSPRSHLKPITGTGGASFPLLRTPKGQNYAHLTWCMHQTRDGPVTSRSPLVAAVPVTKELWENSILNSETPVLVEFYADWCGPCKMLLQVIDEIASEYAGRLKCFALNTDSDLQIAQDYEVKAVPMVVLFKNGRKCGCVIGTMPKQFYVAAIERILKS